MTQLARYDTRPALRSMCDLGFASLCSRVGPCPCSALRPTGTRVFCSLLLGFRLRRKPIKHIADIGRGKRALSIEEADPGRLKRVVVNYNPPQIRAVHKVHNCPPRSGSERSEAGAAHGGGGGCQVETGTCVIGDIYL